MAGGIRLVSSLTALVSRWCFSQPQRGIMPVDFYARPLSFNFSHNVSITSSDYCMAFHLSLVCGVTPGVSNRPAAYWDWIRAATGLSLEYYDVTLSNGGFIRATDASPTTGYLDPGYVTPASASKGDASKPPKMHFNKGVDSWSVSAALPAGATVISQANAEGLDIALYGIFPSTYDRVLDSLHYTAEQCKTAKSGRSINDCKASAGQKLGLKC